MKLETKDGHFAFTVAPQERSLGYLGENGTQTIRIELDQEYSGWIFRMEFGIKPNFVYLTQEGKALVIELERGWLPESGSIPVQICGTFGDIERRSNIVRFQLARSVGALDRPDNYPTAFRQLEQRLMKAKQRVESLCADMGDIESGIEAARAAAAEASGYAAQAARSADTLVVKDTLTSDDTESALAAHQGKVLKERIAAYAVDTRYRDPMTLETVVNYQKSGYSTIGGFCASDETAYLLLSNTSGQIVVGFDRATGAEQVTSSVLPDTCHALAWDETAGQVLACGTAGILVLSDSLRLITRRSIANVLCAAPMGEQNAMAWCVRGALVIGSIYGAEQRRIALPQAIPSPQAMSWQDGRFYLSDSVSGHQRVTALDEEGTVLHVWLLPKVSSTLCGLQAQPTCLLLLRASGGTGTLVQGDYLETAFYSPIS